MEIQVNKHTQREGEREREPEDPGRERFNQLEPEEAEWGLSEILNNEDTVGYLGFMGWIELKAHYFGPPSILN